MAASPYRPSRYRRRRTDRRRLVGVGLALLLVLGMSAAVVAFNRGGDPAPGGGDGAAPSSTAPPASAGAEDGEGGEGGEGREGGADGGTATGPSPTTATTDADGGTDGRGGAADRPAAPEIAQFQATEQGLGRPCDDFERRITLVWESTGATTAQLDGPGAPTDPLPAAGRRTVCRDPGPPVTYTLTVDGPGGTTFRTTSA